MTFNLALLIFGAAYLFPERDCWQYCISEQGAPAGGWEMFGLWVL